MAKSELNDWGQPDYKRPDLGRLVRGKYANLSSPEREKVELEYHGMRPEDFDAAMSQAKRCTPTAVSRSKRQSKGSEKKRAGQTK